MKKPKDDRRKIIDRIISLEMMTEANGCTPAEADSARKAAERLRSRYDIPKVDNNVEGESREEEEPTAFILEKSYPSPDNARHLNQAVNLAAVSVAAHFHCRGFSSGNKYVFFGEERDVLAAHKQLKIICEAADFQHRSLKQYLVRYINQTPIEGHYLHPRTVGAEFRKGFGVRIARRYVEGVRTRTDEKPSASKEPVHCSKKNDGHSLDRLMEFYRERLNLKPGKTNLKDEQTWAYICGWEAGANVQLFTEEQLDTGAFNWDILFTAPVTKQAENKPGHASTNQYMTHLKCDLVYSTGWALYRMGWLLGVIGAIGLNCFEYFPDFAKSHSFNWNMLLTFSVIGWGWLLIGQALGGDQPRKK